MNILQKYRKEFQAVIENSVVDVMIEPVTSDYYDSGDYFYDLIFTW